MNKVAHSYLAVVCLSATVTLCQADDTADSLEQTCPGFTSTFAIDYEVDCEYGATNADVCAVDSGTYAGWVVFDSNCAECHGESAVADAEQPDLLHALSTSVDYDAFTAVLFYGRHSNPEAMPSWQGNCNVITEIDNLYRYLKARSDDALPPGAPKKDQHEGPGETLLPPYAAR